MKLIHCSDIHLGASMRTHLSPEKARKRQEELLATFSRMVNYAVTEGVAGIIIAGDLLDTAECDIKTRNFLLDTIREAPVEVYYLCGNHDENSMLLSSELPKNLHIFGTKWTKFNLGEVTITGATLGTDNEELYRSLSLSPNAFNIVVLHGLDKYGSNINEPDTVNLDMLKNKNIDYLALGHIHSYREGKLDYRATYCFCGCLEGRGFDECGEKGFVLLDINKGQFTRKFVPFARRTLYEVPVDITGLRTTREIINKISDTLDVSPDSLVRVVLTGEYTVDTEKSLSLIESWFDTRYFYFQVRDSSRLQIDLNAYRNDISIAGEFVRMVEESDLDDAEKERVINMGLNALAGREVDV